VVIQSHAILRGCDNYFAVSTV